MPVWVAKNISVRFLPQPPPVHRWYIALLGGALIVAFIMIFVLTTSVALRGYKKLCYVEIG